MTDPARSLAFAYLLRMRARVSAAAKQHCAGFFPFPQDFPFPAVFSTGVPVLSTDFSGTKPRKVRLAKKGAWGLSFQVRTVDAAVL